MLFSIMVRCDLLHRRSFRPVKKRKGNTETYYQKCPIAIPDPGMRKNE